MPLDFNTHETPEPQTDSQDETRDETHDATSKPNQSKYLLSLLLISGVLSLSSLVLSLITINNIPKPEPISIQCDPNLLKKIEKQATILSEIAESTKK